MQLGQPIEGLSYEQYAAEPGLRASDLKLIKRSPAHYKAHVRNPPSGTEAMQFGLHFHKAMENPSLFVERLKIIPKFVGMTKDGKESSRSREAKDREAEWISNLPTDAIPLKEDWVHNLTGMINSVLKHKLVGALVRDGIRESSLWVDDPDSGLRLKCRPDFVSSRGHMVDFKSTRDASKGFFTNQIFSDRGEGPFYVLSAAHYTHCAKLSGMFKSDRFFYVAVEKEDPWGIVVYPLDIGAIDVGERHREILTKRFADCQRTGQWPSYEERAQPVEIPRWVEYPEPE